MYVLYLFVCVQISCICACVFLLLFSQSTKEQGSMVVRLWLTELVGSRSRRHRTAQDDNTYVRELCFACLFTVLIFLFFM